MKILPSKEKDMPNIAKLFLLFFIVFPIRGLYADYSLLRAVEERAQIYYNIGVNTCVLESSVNYGLSESFLKYENNKQEITFMTAFHSDDLLNNIKECIFYTKGAMGEHLPQIVVDFLAQAMAEFIYNQTKNTKHPVYYYRVDENLENIDVSSYSPCTMAIEHNGETLVMQGRADIP